LFRIVGQLSGRPNSSHQKFLSCTLNKKSARVRSRRNSLLFHFAILFFLQKNFNNALAKAFENKNRSMKSKKIFALFSLMISLQGFSQNVTTYKKWNPASDTLQVLEGQAWSKEVKNYYDRLPARAEHVVRDEVWELSQNSAGLSLRFRTNANDIIVKYAVSENLQMSHMPATGVSGVDLYAKNSDGKWLWCAGRYSFGDTIVYRFRGMLSKDENGNPFEYTLYLPLYNSVKWLEINVPEESLFKPLSARKEKPILVYGTSIAQGWLRNSSRSRMDKYIEPKIRQTGR